MSEIVKIERALETGALIFDRVEALRGEVERLKGAERTFAEKLLRLEQKGFRPRLDGIVDEAQNVTLWRLDAYYGRFRRHRFGAPDTRPARPSVAELSSPPDERLVDGGVREYAATLATSLPGEWGETYGGARMVQSVHFNIDQWLLVLDVDPRRPPPAAALTRLNVRHMTSAHPAASRVQLFVRLRNAAFQIDVVDLTKSWQSILNPSANPDVYHALGCADAWVGPQPPPAVDAFPPCEPPVWTPVLAHFFRHEKMLFRELLDQPAVYKLASLDFLRVFWKMAQLVAMNRSATTDRVLFPMTPGAIRRALDDQDVPMPSQLASFEQAYPRVLRGETSDVGVADLVPEAVSYLKEIDL